MNSLEQEERQRLGIMDNNKTELNGAGGEGLKNTFRDEAKKQTLTPEEEMKRNGAVHLVQLRLRRDMTNADRQHILNTIDRITATRNQMMAMDSCEAREINLEAIDKQIEQMIEQAKQCEQSLGNAITLNALEQLAEIDEPALAKTATEEVAEVPVGEGEKVPCVHTDDH